MLYDLSSGAFPSEPHFLGQRRPPTRLPGRLGVGVPPAAWSPPGAEFRLLYMRSAERYKESIRSETLKHEAAVALGRKGGQARAAKLTAEQRSAQARQA